MIHDKQSKSPVGFHEPVTRLAREANRLVQDDAHDLAEHPGYVPGSFWAKQTTVAEPTGWQPKREELTALRREVRDLRRANEILKAASAFFARELDQPRPR